MFPIEVSTLPTTGKDNVILPYKNKVHYFIYYLKIIPVLKIDLNTKIVNFYNNFH